MGTHHEVDSVNSRDTNNKQHVSSRAASFSIDAILGRTSENKTQERTANTETSEDDVVDVESECSNAEDRSPDMSGSKPEPTDKLHHRAAASRRTGTSSGTGHEVLAGVKCKLETKDLWDKFHELGTEMIITKSGRRMFPTVRVSFTGLETAQSYLVMLDIVAVDNKRYRYAYHRSSWLVAGKADPALAAKLYPHPDTPITGEQLLKQSVSFEKVKLTNNTMETSGHIVLNSMHKYQPRVHLIQKRVDGSVPLSSDQLTGDIYRTFVFPESRFIAVTAYQNQLITKLKIDSNPFAKGFRDSSRLSDMERENMESLIRMQSYTQSAIIPPAMRELNNHTFGTTSPSPTDCWSPSVKASDDLLGAIHVSTMLPEHLRMMYRPMLHYTPGALAIPGLPYWAHLAQGHPAFQLPLSPALLPEDLSSHNAGYLNSPRKVSLKELEQVHSRMRYHPYMSKDRPSICVDGSR